MNMLRLLSHEQAMISHVQVKNNSCEQVANKLRTSLENKLNLSLVGGELGLTVSRWVGGATAYLGGATAYLADLLDEIKAISAQLSWSLGRGNKMTGSKKTKPNNWAIYSLLG